MTKVAPHTLALLVSLTALPACLGQGEPDSTELSAGAVTAGSTAVGAIPAGLPPRGWSACSRKPDAPGWRERGALGYALPVFDAGLGEQLGLVRTAGS